MKIYDGQGMILGRLACRIAKDALLGENVEVINCDKIVVSGNKVNTIAASRSRRARSGYPLAGPNHSRLPDRYVRRAIRGMLPWRATRGREAFKRIMCHVGVPSQFAGKETVKVQEASTEKLPTLKFVTIADMCKALGGK